MSGQSKTDIVEMEKLLAGNDMHQVLSFLANKFRMEKKYAELFEVLKYKIRLELELPLSFDANQPQNEEQQRQLEDRLLNACLEVGTLMVNGGQISEGWLYLQPVLDRNKVSSIIANVDVTDDNVSEVIEVALCQWAAPKFGYRLLLKNQGTCNGITFFDTQIMYQDPRTRQELAEILVEHIYEELRENVSTIIKENEQQENLPQNLLALIHDRSWLFDNCGHHLDVTHLASVVRIARVCESTDSIQQAMEMAEYGIRLDKQLHYESEPPFENLYDDHAIFFRGLIQRDEQAICHFEAKCKSLANTEFAASANSTLVELSSRTGRSDRAINVLMENSKLEPELFSKLISVADSKEDFDQIMKFFKEKDDLFGFGLSAVHKHCSVQ